MPAAIPIIAGVAGLIANNVNQKAADKNNENQQTAAVQNAESAAQKAQAGYAAAGGASPSPFASTSIAQPKAGNPAQGAMIQQILQAAAKGQGASKPMAAAPIAPQSGVVSAILGQ